jgi:hypothetical protein
LPRPAKTLDTFSRSTTKRTQITLRDVVRDHWVVAEPLFHQRTASARCVAHLAEIDDRRLYLGAGYSSLFSYCTEVLHLSEAEAYNRIEAARAARKFPAILDMLGDGSLNLTTVRLLAPHLSGDNQWELLEDLARKKFAATKRPRTSRGTAPGSRHVAAKVRRAVWLRDGGRCAFIGQGRRRCNERAFIEFHHLDRHGVGGEGAVDNIELRCRAHNAYEVEIYYGRGKRRGSDGAVGEPSARYGNLGEPLTRSGTSPITAGP